MSTSTNRSLFSCNFLGVGSVGALSFCEAGQSVVCLVLASAGALIYKDWGSRLQALVACASHKEGCKVELYAWHEKVLGCPCCKIGYALLVTTKAQGCIALSLRKVERVGCICHKEGYKGGLHT